MYERENKLIKLKTENITNSFISKKKKKKETKDRIIRDIWTFFETEKEKKERNKLEKKRT